MLIPIVLGTSPVELTVEDAGDHTLRVIPQECGRIRTHAYKFTVE